MVWSSARREKVSTVQVQFVANLTASEAVCIQPGWEVHRSGISWLFVPLITKRDLRGWSRTIETHPYLVTGEFRIEQKIYVNCLGWDFSRFKKIDQLYNVMPLSFFTFRSRCTEKYLLSFWRNFEIFNDKFWAKRLSRAQCRWTLISTQHSWRTTCGAGLKMARALSTFERGRHENTANSIWSRCDVGL